MGERLRRLAGAARPLLSAALLTALLASLLTALLAGVVSLPATAAEELSGDQIIARSDQAMNYTGKYLMDFTIIRPGRDSRTSRIQLWVKGLDRVLVRYLAPAEEKGTGYLRVGEDTWLYLPSAQKSIRVSGKQSLQGSDLSNDDILRLHLKEDYSAKVVGEEQVEDKANWVLELTAKRPSVTYGKLRYWVRQEDYLPSKAEYYALSGKLLKTMACSKFKVIGGRVRPTVTELASELKKGYKTVVVIVEADHEAQLPDTLFTRFQLEKGQ